MEWFNDKKIEWITDRWMIQVNGLLVVVACLYSELLTKESTQGVMLGMSWSTRGSLEYRCKLLPHQ